MGKHDRVENGLDLDEGAPASNSKIPLPLKVFGILCIVSGAALVPVLALLIVGMVMALQQGAQIAEVMIVILILVILCDMMLSGLTPDLIPYGVVLVVLVALSSYVDPSLAEERELRRKLRDMETREAAEEGTLGRDETGKGFIALNFFNLFWIFVVCCVLGLMIETAYHFLVVNPRHYQDRAGLLFGPFSPIYGFGAVLMTVALNRFHDKNVVLIFLVSAVIGGAFEYLTSWFMQFAFGIVAWDYSGTFLSIDGRTNGMFMAMWGVLGVVWIKLLLPWMLKLVNLIPWNWRYAVTTVCAALMIVDGAMTLLSLDCWYQREAGKPPETAVAHFFAEHFDNQYMENRFQRCAPCAAPAPPYAAAEPVRAARTPRTASRPITTPARQASTLPHAYSAPVAYLPRSSKARVSSENAENVVKPPHTPVLRNNTALSGKPEPSVAASNTAPMSTAPAKLTANVMSGKSPSTGTRPSR